MSFSTTTSVFAASSKDGMLARLKRTFYARLVANRTRAALLRLTPRELEDIGLAPADIERTARRVAGI